ncbi:hypothetical protein O181_050872 [Austropuccinia psidii MF-1]|uniref:Uncharacterized protein n=1 Tax=Austropuccinia psidii MF-1 TaxID=1389203 RepID=A0A9Q3E4J7_9BASI|nr:hypothetical protein [Austropuccinia psidii MF-1]
MSHTLTYHSIQNVPLHHHHIGRGIGTNAPAPTWAHAHAPAPVHAHANTNAAALHLWYCAAGSTSVILKMAVLRRRSPFMDDLVRLNPPPLHQDWLKDLFDVCVWKQEGLV